MTWVIVSGPSSSPFSRSPRGRFDRQAVPWGSSFRLRTGLQPRNASKKGDTIMSDRHPSGNVLIVGAGPTGLTLAYELLRQGVRVRLIEKEPTASRNAKALGMWPRTLELFA